MEIIQSSSDEKYVKGTQQHASMLIGKEIDIWNLETDKPFSVSIELVLQAIEKLKDKEVLVRKKIKGKLIELYHNYCVELSKRVYIDQFTTHLEKIPFSLISCALDDECEKTRLINVDLLITEELFPDSISAMHITYHWLIFFSYFSPSQRKDLVSILSEKRRFKEEMKGYLKLWEQGKMDFSVDLPEKFSSYFSTLSAFFMNHSEAEACFQMLHELDDNEIFEDLSQLLRKKTVFALGGLFRESILTRIGDKPPLNGFMRILVVKCSYSVFSICHVEQILIVLNRRLIMGLDGDGRIDMSTFNLSSVIDLISMILLIYPKFLKFVKRKFPNLVSVVAPGTSTEIPRLIPSQESAMKDTCKVHGEDIDMWDAAMSNPFSVPSSLVFQTFEILKDKELFVRRQMKEKLLNLYHSYCVKLCERRYVNQFVDHLEEIPSILIATALNEDSEHVRRLITERLIVEELFPCSVLGKHYTYHWIHFFRHFSSSQRKALQSILSEKKRFRAELKGYIKLRKEGKKNFSVDLLLEKISAFFSKMSAFFMDPFEALACFQMLHQLNDVKLFSLLSHLIHKDTWLGYRPVLQRLILTRIADKHQLGDKHPLHGFLKILMMRCSYSIFTVDVANDILSVLDHRIVKELEGDGRVDMSSFDLTCAIDLFVMIVEVYPKFLKRMKERFSELFSMVAASTSSGMLHSISNQSQQPLRTPQDRAQSHHENIHQDNLLDLGMAVGHEAENSTSRTMRQKRKSCQAPHNISAKRRETHNVLLHRLGVGIEKCMQVM